MRFFRVRIVVSYDCGVWEKERRRVVAVAMCCQCVRDGPFHFMVRSNKNGIEEKRIKEKLNCTEQRRIGLRWVKLDWIKVAHPLPSPPLSILHVPFR